MNVSETENNADNSEPNVSTNSPDATVAETPSNVNGDKNMDIDENNIEAIKEEKGISTEIKEEIESDNDSTANRKRKLDDRDELSDGSSSPGFLGFPADTRTEEEKKAAAKKKQEKPKLELLVFDSSFGKGKRSRIPNKRYESLTIKSFSKSRYDDDGTEVTSSEEGRNDDDHEHNDDVSSSGTSPTRSKHRTSSSGVSTIVPYKKQKISSDMTNPNFIKPFKYGWKRELVYRATMDNNLRRNGDIYYYTPTGKKIRSMRELSENMVTPELTLDDFSFWKEPVGINEPEKEIIREAKMKGSNTPTFTKRATPKGKVVKEKEKPTPSPKGTPIVESPPSKNSTKSPRLGGFKVKIASSRLSQSSKQTTKKTSQADNDMEIGMLPPAWSPKKGSTTKQSSWQAKTGSIHSPLDTNKLLRPCSIRCLGVSGLIPTLQCRLCLCLYHKECVGENSDDVPAGYVCKNCQLDNQGKIETAYTSGPPPLTPFNVLKSHINQSPTPTKLHRISRPGDKPFNSVSTAPKICAPLKNKFSRIFQSDLFNLAPAHPEPSKSIVGSVTTWFPPNSRLKLNQNNSQNTSLDFAQAPTPQGLILIGEKQFLVVPKGNVLSISPTVGVAINTPIIPPILLPTPDKPPELAPKEIENKITETAYVSNDSIKQPVPADESPPLENSEKSPEIPSENSSVPPMNEEEQEIKLSTGETLKETQIETTPTKTRRGSIRKSGAAPTPIVKIDRESLFMQNYLQNLSYGYQTILYVFQYLKVQDLLRAGCVCTLWRDIAGHPSLWKTVRMKNSQVANWEGLADALKKHRTENLDLRKMLLPNSSDDMWPLFSKAIARVDSLVRIELCRCPASVIEELAKLNENLLVINAVTIRCETLDISSMGNLEKLQELRLKSTNGFTLSSDLSPLKTLTKLKHLSLTSVKELNKQQVTIIGELVNLETLDLGECTDFPENFGTEVIAKLTKLEKLRLEKGQGSCGTFNILDAVSKIYTLEQLELVNFDVKAGFDKALGACDNIKKLLIIPTYISQSATTNHMVLGGVIKLKSTLSHFVWGVTLELLRVTELFVDQCEDTPNKDKKKPSGNGDSIPVLKPVPIMKQDIVKEDVSSKEPPQVEILPLPTLQKLLLNCLPTTRVKILKIPFHATWRQSIVDTVN